LVHLLLVPLLLVPVPVSVLVLELEEVKLTFLPPLALSCILSPVQPKNRPNVIRDKQVRNMLINKMVEGGLKHANRL
jgi:hypothetical protein